jgi:KDO2-lipid IV(A) lauroyltransferase
LSLQEENPLVEALRENMGIVLDLPREDSQLDEVVFNLLRNTIFGYIDLFYALHGEQEISCLFEPDLELILLLERCLESKQGLVLVGTHTCGFDLQMLGLLDLLPSVQVLSNSNPQGSSVVMNELRTREGLLITPISRQSLRVAVHRLRSGGVVALANDIPSADGRPLQFFGKECTMPVGHARLAAMTESMMLVSGSFRSDSGRYKIHADCVPAPGDTNERAISIPWAQEALKKTEAYIRRYPDQWLMPQAVWGSECPS